MNTRAQAGSLVFGTRMPGSSRTCCASEAAPTPCPRLVAGSSRRQAGFPCMTFLPSRIPLIRVGYSGGGFSRLPFAAISESRFIYFSWIFCAQIFPLHFWCRWRGHWLFSHIDNQTFTSILSLHPMSSSRRGYCVLKDLGMISR